MMSRRWLCLFATFACTLLAVAALAQTDFGLLTNPPIFPGRMVRTQHGFRHALNVPEFPPGLGSWAETSPEPISRVNSAREAVFFQPPAYPTGANPQFLLEADINGDGKPDFGHRRRKLLGHQSV